MKRITIGLVSIFTLLPAISYADANTKNEVKVPSYNSGLSFGLAAYSNPVRNQVKNSQTNTNIPATEQSPQSSATL